jgi:hypothetical protein
MKQLSPDIEVFLTHVESAGISLRKRIDIGLIFDYAALHNNYDQINDLVFTGKIVWNTYSALKKRNQTDEGYDLLEKQFMESVHTLRNSICQQSIGYTKEEQSRIEEIYLTMSQGTLRNIVDLAHDLSEIKNLQNSAKHKK